MPMFPRSPLSFRTAGFPQYGWKAGFPSGAFLGDRRLKLLPTCAVRRPVCIRPSCAVVPLCVGPPTRLRTAVEGYYLDHPSAEQRPILSTEGLAGPPANFGGPSRFAHGRCFTRSIRVCSKTTERELLPGRGWCSGAVVRSSIRSLSLRHNGSRVCSCDRPAANGRLWAPPRSQHRLRPFTSGFGRTTPRSGIGRYSSISEAAVIGSADDSRQLPAPNA
jgi:hypothetical protein